MRSVSQTTLAPQACSGKALIKSSRRTSQLVLEPKRHQQRLSTNIRQAIENLKVTRQRSDLRGPKDREDSSSNSRSLASRESLRKLPDGRVGIEFETIKEEMIPAKHHRGESFINKS